MILRLLAWRNGASSWRPTGSPDVLPDLLVTAMSIVLAAALPGSPVDPAMLTDAGARLEAGLAQRTAVAYLPASRAVTNWRDQAAAHLDLPATDALRLRLGGDLAGLPRCVRLNNYWCIKKAGWAGEIAADGEGHVAFGSSLEGAAVAAILLRRYYSDYHRTSALAIVSRWAPAGCGAPAGVARIAQTRRALGPAPPDRLAVHGVRNTLRARFLAHGRGRMAHGARGGHRSRIADRALPMLPAPSIMAGAGEKPIALPAIRLASLGTPELGGTLPGLPPLPRLNGLPPLPACTPDTARVADYAAATARGVTPKPTDDLHLFLPDGTPTPNLAQVMANMAAVEIGPRRVDDALIAEAIALMTRTRSATPAPAAPDAAPATQPAP